MARIQKPLLGAQINYGHRLAPTYAIMLMESRGHPFDTQGNKGVRTGGADWYAPGFIRLDGSDDYVIFNNDSGSLSRISGLTAGFSVVLKGRMGASGQASKGICTVLDGSDRGWGIFYGNDGSNISFPGPLITTSAAVPQVSSEYMTLVAVSLTASSHRLYKNAKDFGSPGTVTITASTTAGLVFGRIYPFFAGFHGSFDVEYLLVYTNRALTLEEAGWLYHEPYCFMQNPRRSYFVKAPSTGLPAPGKFYSQAVKTASNY